jgi:dimeric dUTPase (all-alpha-NTP-PPase superfamily)
MEIEEFYTPEENKFNELKKNFPAGTYYYWLSVFNKVCEKLQISEQKLLDIYLTKNKINQQRAQAK